MRSSIASWQCYSHVALQHCCPRLFPSVLSHFCFPVLHPTLAPQSGFAWVGRLNLFSIFHFFSCFSCVHVSFFFCAAMRVRVEVLASGFSITTSFPVICLGHAAIFSLVQNISVSSTRVTSSVCCVVLGQHIGLADKRTGHHLTHSLIRVFPPPVHVRGYVPAPITWL